MDDDPLFNMTPKQRYDASIAKMNVRAIEHRRLCEKYMRRARNIGWDVDTDMVLDNFPWFDAWARRFIPVGHLVSRVGLRRMSRSDYLEWSRTLTIPKVVMLDTVGTAAQHIPTVTPYVGGYISGSGAVPWTQAEWNLFPNARHNRILQHANTGMNPHAWDSLDMETNALTAADVAQEHKHHVDAGIEWTNIYATRSNFALAAPAIKELGPHYWDGHVTLWLADWNLDEEEAAALIGTMIEGATCIAVQWASPTSNPNTLVPGGSATLVQANIDISVVDGTWIPSVSFGTPPVVTPPPVVEHGILVTDDGHGGVTEKSVSSTDDTHWQ